MKVIIGAGKTSYDGWISTQEDELNLLNENDGKIGRSFRFDTRNSEEKLGMVSIILDAKKVKSIEG